MTTSFGSPARATFLTGPQGEHFKIIGGDVRILADGASTGGRCFVFDAPIAPGDGPPLHKHEREDELFYILEGRFKFVVDGQVFIAERGSFALAPRGSMHTFRNIGPSMGLLHIVCTPAGLEETFRRVRYPAPDEHRAGLTPEQAIAEFAKHGITFHGPPLDATE